VGYSRIGLPSKNAKLGGIVVELHPLSCIQELMLAYSAQFGFDISLWNQQIIFELNQLDSGRIESVLRDSSDRHSILRTHLCVRDGSHGQAVEDVGHRLEHRSYDERTLDPEKLEAQRPFDLLDAPLWRSAVATDRDGRARLIVTFNHLLADRQSDRMFAREFVSLYDGSASPLSVEPAPYSDFARWQRSAVADFVTSSAALAGWAEYERTIRAMRMPPESRRTSPVDDTVSIRSECTWSLSREDTARIAAHAKYVRASVNSVLTAAVSTALALMPDLEIGLLIGERSTRYPHRFSDTLGPFPDPWPISTPLDRSTNFADSLDLVRRRGLAAIDAPLPFHALLSRVPWLSREFRESGAPFKMFYQFFGDSDFSLLSGSRTSAVRFPAMFGEHSDVFGIHAMMGLRGGELHATVAYRHSIDGRTGVATADIDSLAEAMSAVLGRQCGHAVNIVVSHDAG
jgi:hypothetical protein